MDKATIVLAIHTKDERFPIYAVGRAWLDTLEDGERLDVMLAVQRFMEIVGAGSETAQAAALTVYLKSRRDFREFAAGQGVTL